jgi:25S rRNA (cytosine2870-C5)-methyltransferase
MNVHSDEDVRGPTMELDLGSEEDNEPELAPKTTKLKSKRSKQAERPTKIIPTQSDASSSDDDGESNDEEGDSDEDGPVNITNMEARSRALDAKAAREAELDAEELRRAAEEAEEDGADEFEGLDEMDEDGEEEDGEKEQFVLPTAAEREAEKSSGGPDVHLVQRRMRECVRVLGKWKKLGANSGRSALLP